MGLPDDSTVLILTLIWGSCVVVGKCDIRNSVVTDNKDTKGFSLTGIYVHCKLFSIPNQEPSRSFGCARYLCRTVSFLLPYQVFQPWIQYMWRRIAYAKHKHLYGSATMNNVLFLLVFLALVYFRELMWDFSALVLIMLIVCVVTKYLPNE
ncbi:hypothetical protein FF2_007644 [Malus domestica]